MLLPQYFDEYFLEKKKQFHSFGVSGCFELTLLSLRMTQTLGRKRKHPVT